MGKPLAVLAAAAAVFLALVAVDVIPLGWFDAGSAGGSGPAEDALLSGEDEAARLEGRARAGAEDGDTTALEAAPAVPAEVHGTTEDGAQVRGRVVFDVSGAPARGVTVRLGRRDAIFHYLNAEPEGRFDVLEASTGDDGRFAFLDVTPSDQYVVRCRLEPHAYVSSDTLDLRGRQHVDCGDLRLGPAGAVTGRVIDAEGRPVPDVRVAATWKVDNRLGVILADPDTLPEVEAEAKTDAEGVFHVGGLEPGPKTLVLQAPSGAAEVVRSITVIPERESPAGDIMLAGNHVIAGTVTWSDGEPIAGARVFAGPNQRAALRTTATAEDGTFRLEWLPEGSHAVGVLVPDMPVDLQQVETGTEDLTVVFRVPGRLTGRVLQAAGREPVTTFAVQAMKTDVDGQARFIQALVLQALGPEPFEDAKGRFELPRLAPGEYVIEVRAPGFPNARESGVVITGDETQHVLVELPRGNVARGRVVRANGQPLARAQVHVLRREVDASGPALAEQMRRRAPETTTRGDGSFEIPPQAPGTVHLAVVHEDAVATVHAGVDLTRGDATGVEVVMPAAGRLEGRLLTDGGRPAEGETVYLLYPDGTAYQEPAQEDGRFRFEGLPLGACLVRWLSVRDMRRFLDVVGGEDADAKRAAYDDLRTEGGGEHFVTDGRTLTVTLRLPRRVRFQGRVPVGGEPARETGLWLALPDGGWGTWIRTDEDGAFDEHVEAGRYVVWIPDAEGVWRKDEIEIPDHREFSMDFTR